jgi:hypothetical protein
MKRTFGSKIVQLHVHSHSISFTVLENRGSKSRRQSPSMPLSVAGLVSKSNAILQSLFIVRRNKLYAFDVAAARIVRHLNHTLVLVVTDHDNVATENHTLHLGRLFIIIVIIVGVGAGTLAFTAA